jgi:hypothetical protein
MSALNIVTVIAVILFARLAMRLLFKKSILDEGDDLKENQEE